MCKNHTMNRRAVPESTRGSCRFGSVLQLGDSAGAESVVSPRVFLRLEEEVGQLVMCVSHLCSRSPSSSSSSLSVGLIEMALIAGFLSPRFSHSVILMLYLRVGKF